VEEEAMWFHPIFWLAVIFFVMHSARRRRWRRWAMMQDGMFGPYGLYLAHERGVERGLRAPRQRREPDDATLVEQLESRIAELEQRLDFTERLLAERREP
jgi:hypothetical protein